MQTPSQILLVAGAALAVLGWAECGLAQTDPGSRPGTLVTGRVLERGSDTPVAGARVVLVGTGLERATDGQGLFDFLRVPPGRYWLHVEHIGYGPADDSVTVPPRGRLDLSVRLAPRPVELEPVVASAERASTPGMRGFYERKRTGGGRYLTRADFEEPGVNRVTDPIRRLPEVRVVPRVVSGYTVGHSVLIRGDCRATVYVDGVLLSPGGPTLDEILSPYDVEGIEVYSGAQTPVGFAGADACGVIAVWTRPGGGRGRLSLGRGLLYAGGFLALALLLIGVL